jgi:hypothetical protein
MNVFRRRATNNQFARIARFGYRKRTVAKDGLGSIPGVVIGDTMTSMPAKPLQLVAYSPLGVTALLVIWTMLVSPHAKYGDSWAIDPALGALPLVVGLHVLLAYKSRWRRGFIAYGLFHGVIFFAIWLYCLMMISKDSL